MGPEVFGRHFADGLAGQGAAVREVVTSSEINTWIYEVESAPIGFIAVRLDPPRSTGSIWLLAVDPDSQNRGVGTALTEHAVNWMRESGMHIAMVETGSDPGHAPARRTYEKLGFVERSPVRYWLTF